MLTEKSARFLIYFTLTIIMSLLVAGSAAIVHIGFDYLVSQHKMETREIIAFNE